MSGKNGEEPVIKTVRLRQDQAEWLDARAVNFSELVRRLIDSYIAEQDAPRRNGNAHREVAGATA